MLAQDEARLLDHHFIGTEHILLGLLSEGGGVAAQALSSMGLSLEVTRHKVQETVGQLHATPAPASPPLTPRAKKLLELSLREMVQLGHEGIDTEHLLLGLIHQTGSVAERVLVGLGTDLGRLRHSLLSLMAQPGYAPCAEGATAAGTGFPACGGFTRLPEVALGPNARTRVLRGRAKRQLLPGWLVGIIDPAQRYMDRSSGRRRTRRPPRGTASYGPLTAEPGRNVGTAAPARPADPLPASPRPPAGDRHNRIDTLIDTFRPLLEAGASELLDRGQATVRTPSATLSARIIGFRWGDRVLEIEGPGPGASEGRCGGDVRPGPRCRTLVRARLVPAGERVDVLVRYLAFALADLGGS